MFIIIGFACLKNEWIRYEQWMKSHESLIDVGPNKQWVRLVAGVAQKVNLGRWSYMKTWHPPLSHTSSCVCLWAWQAFMLCPNILLRWFPLLLMWVIVDSMKFINNLVEKLGGMHRNNRSLMSLSSKFHHHLTPFSKQMFFSLHLWKRHRGRKEKV